jgi:hypothetical protein
LGRLWVHSEGWHSRNYLDDVHAACSATAPSNMSRQHCRVAVT